MSALPILHEEPRPIVFGAVAPATTPTAMHARLEQLTARHPRLRLHHPGLVQPGLSQPSQAPDAAAAQRWNIAALEGRLVEISGEGRTVGLTLAARLTAQAQDAGDIAAWVCGPEGTFYPPDLATHGIDLRQLAVIRAPSAEQVALAAIRLLHSGGFGLVVLDLAGPPVPSATSTLPKPHPAQPHPSRAHPRWDRSNPSNRKKLGDISDAHLGRLVQQAQKHQATVVCLTRKPAQQESLGSLVSLRAEGGVKQVAPDRFLCTATVLKDKRHGAGWQHQEVFGGPPGLH